jgi:hypothetical protein
MITPYLVLLTVVSTGPSTDFSEMDIKSLSSPIHQVDTTYEQSAMVSKPHNNRLDMLHYIRVQKAERLIRRFANHDGNASFLPYAEDLVSYCEYIEQSNDAPGFGGTWYWALVYGYANFNLRCYKIAYYPPRLGDDCTGPFDVKKEPHVLDPVDNMKHHVDEQYTGWKKGYRGIGLCKYVMYPARPHDWGGGQFAKTHRKFSRFLGGLQD